MPIRSVGRWKADSEASSCETCRKAFSFVRRKHHCRLCGGLFCADCSKQKILVPQVDSVDPQRVCRPCYSKNVAEKNARNAAQVKKRNSPLHASEKPVSEKPSATTESVSNGATSSCVMGVEDSPRGVGEERVEDEHSKPATELPVETLVYDKDHHHHSDHRSEEEEEDEESGTGTPRIILPVISEVSQASVHSALSFIAALQDTIKKKDSNESISILMYPGVGKEQSMVVTFSPEETMGDLIEKLAGSYFKLQHGIFKRPTPEGLAVLKTKLQFLSECQTIRSDMKAIEVTHFHHTVILTDLPPMDVQLVVESNRSVQSFFQSHGSDTEAEGFGDDDAICA